jgi:hypothetical protein
MSASFLQEIAPRARLFDEFNGTDGTDATDATDGTDGKKD